MRSYSGPEVVRFRDGVSGGDVLGLGVLDPRAASGPALVVAPAPKNARQGAPHLLDLPRSVFLDSSLTDGRGGRYSFFTADPFLVIRSRGRRVELTGPAGQVVTEGSLDLTSAPTAPLLGRSGTGSAAVFGRCRRLFWL